MSTIIWCHGGCFSGGNASYDKKVREFLQSKGYTVIAPEFRKDWQNSVRDIMEEARNASPPVIYAGVSSGGFLAHMAANLSNLPAFLLCPVVKPHDRHESLEAKFQKLQLDFFETEQNMKAIQNDPSFSKPNAPRYCIFGSLDSRAPVQAISDWMKDESVKNITVYVVENTHVELCKNPPLDLLLKCVQNCFRQKIRPTNWIYMGFPGRSRSMFATYETFDYEDLPEIKEDERFANINTVQDVKDNLDELNKIIRSPTSCYFDFSRENLFYRDQQDCVMWFYTPQKGVYTGQGYCVAKSIPEFLTRIHIENEIFWVNRVRDLEPRAFAYLRYYNPKTN